MCLFFVLATFLLFYVIYCGINAWNLLIWERGNAYADKSCFINSIITQNTFHINGQTFEIAKIFSKQLCLDLMPWVNKTLSLCQLTCTPTLLIIKRVFCFQVILLCFSQQFAEKDLEVWSRALSNGSVAAVLFNRNAGSAQEIKADFELVCVNWHYYFIMGFYYLTVKFFFWVMYV